MNQPSTALVSTDASLSHYRTVADWEARAAFWVGRILYWAFDPIAALYDDRAGALENAFEGMRDAREAADFCRRFGHLIER